MNKTIKRYNKPFYKFLSIYLSSLEFKIYKDKHDTYVNKLNKIISLILKKDYNFDQYNQQYYYGNGRKIFMLIYDNVMKEIQYRYHNNIHPMKRKDIVIIVGKQLLLEV